MPVNIVKVVKGPFGTQIKFGISGAAVIGAFLAFAHWARPAMGLLYAFLDFFTVQRWAIVFFGTTIVTAGFLLVCARPQFKQGWRSLVTTIAILLGGIPTALALLADHIVPPRWTGPSIGLVQVDNESELREPIGRMIYRLGRQLNESVEFAQIIAPENGIVQALKKVRRFQHDIVILDYYEPLQLADVRFADMLNPRTLYVLTRPGDSRQPLSPNVISLSPPVVEEVYALATLVGLPVSPVQIVRSAAPRAELAAYRLRQALTAREIAVGPTLERDLMDVELIPGRTTVWIGWRPATLPDGSVIRGPCVIMAEDGGGLRIHSLAVLPYLSGEVQADEVWRQNQLLALGAIMDAHFVKSGRPLDTRVSMDAVVERLASLHLATVSREMRLVPRYSELGGPK